MASQTKLSRHYETCKFEVPCPDCGERYAGQAKLAFHMEACGGSPEDSTEMDEGATVSKHSNYER